MTREEQDKLWAELSEESKNKIRKDYNNSIQNSPIEMGKRCKIYSYECLFGEHNLKPVLTYEDVARELFKDGAWQPHDYASKYYLDKNAEPTYLLNCTSQKQSEKLCSINKLLNVAKFLNKDWKPDLSDKDAKSYTLGIDNNNSIKIIEVRPYYMFTTEIVEFEEKELAEQAVQVLGEDVIKTALTTEY